MNLERLKVSNFWFEPLPELLAERCGGEPQAPSPARAATRASTYEGYFEQARRGEGPYTLPWGEDTLSYFWRYYLGRNPPKRVDAWRSWDRLVPLRRGAEILNLEKGGHVVAADGSRLQVESFHYPHGIGVVITVTLAASLELGAAVDQMQEILREDVLLVSGPGNLKSPSVPRLASDVLDGLRHEALSDSADRENGLRTDSFSIATVLSGSPSESWPGQEPPDELRRALQGLCTSRPEWRDADLLPLRSCSLRLRKPRVKEDLLFGVGRGRAVWFPRRFAATNGKNRSLGCYHRNLTLASLQTESLLQLAAITAAALDAKAPPLPVRWEEVARRGALLLGWLYAGSGSYRSWSTVIQIRQDPDLLRAANRVRDYFGLPSLSRAIAPREAGGPGAKKEIQQTSPAAL